MSGLKTFEYKGGELEVTSEMLQAYKEDGFVIVRQLASAEELRILEEAVTGPDSLSTYAYGNDDGQGQKARMALWNHPGEDSTGVWSRTRKLASTAEKLLGGEVYHYHTKLMMKEALTGGQFVWHQDYGYWYNFACLFPDMMTVFVAVDRCGKDNGCLQVLKGSHKCGRINHNMAGDQQGADPGRVAELQKVFQKVHVELQPGDALFFHCNLLHTSSANTSPHRRWALLTAYNRSTNGPVQDLVHGIFQPLSQVDNDALLRLGVNRDLKGKDIVVKKDGQYARLEN